MTDPSSDITVATPCGALRGRTDGAVARFAGIPFAEAPKGERRFAAPIAAADHTGELDATEFREVSPQNPSMMDALFGGESERWSEDCLHLNVWTPQPSPDASLPVMVWIHGGGFEMGSGSSPLYDGDSFARSGVVCVTLNYRLGSLGFLELGHLDPTYRGSGNAGLLDQIEALRWVKRNIAALGGDPDNVTIFGESAGAMSVGSLLTSPPAEGLFHKAICQSGALSSAKTLEAAHADTDEFMRLGGFGSVADLLDASVAELLAVHAKMSAERIADPEGVIGRYGSPLAFLPFRPVADGEVIALDPLGALAGGSADGIPLLVGTNLEEWKLFAMMTPASDTDDKLRNRFALVLDDPSSALAAYAQDHPGSSPSEVEVAFLTDLVFRIPAEQMIAAQLANGSVWQYRFDWPSPSLGGLLGAAHAIEIPFVFDMVSDHRLHVMVGADAPQNLARGMHEAWVAFAREGRPQVEGVEWPQSDSTHPVMVFDVESTVVHDPLSVTREYWTEGPGRSASAATR